MSDGVIYAGAGSILNLQGWTWEAMAEYTLKCTKNTLSASRLAVMLSQACDELYEEKPGDDTTVAVARVIERRVVNIFTGPPKSKEDDKRLMYDFMHAEGKKLLPAGQPPILPLVFSDARSSRGWIAGSPMCRPQPH